MTTSPSLKRHKPLALAGVSRASKATDPFKLGPLRVTGVRDRHEQRDVINSQSHQKVFSPPPLILRQMLRWDPSLERRVQHKWEEIVWSTGKIICKHDMAFVTSHVGHLSPRGLINVPWYARHSPRASRNCGNCEAVNLWSLIDAKSIPPLSSRRRGNGHGFNVFVSDRLYDRRKLSGFRI
jgi:hypothetical protein